MKYSVSIKLSLTLAGLALGLSCWADVVTDWSFNLDKIIETTAQPVPTQARSIAIVHTAIYEAVNGIVGAYTPFFVTETGPPFARPDAAAVGAAYTAMLSLYPSQKTNLDAMFALSLQNLSANTNSPAISNGLDWGEHVANLILAWRTNDGFNTSPPPYFGGGAAGVWRSPPSGTNADGTLPAIYPQLATLTPFAMTNHAQFRPDPPPDLASAQYATDVNEVEAIGRSNSVTRTSDETQLALLWQAVGPVDENRIVRSVVPPENSLVENARLFALVNIAAADAIIAGFDSKYTYNLWRPYHAIRLADTNSNPALKPDPTWDSLFLPPRFQEYMSNHATITTAIMHILALLLGDSHGFKLAAPGYPSFTWSFTSFSDAIAQVKEARIWAGIHFRNSVNVGETQGTALANYVATNFLLPAPASSLVVVNPTNTYEGKTYAQWSAACWQWIYYLPADKHPLFDTADVSAGQSGDVWFLGGTFATAPGTNGAVYGTANRNCSIPQGKALFFPLIDAESSVAEGNGTNYAELATNSQAIIDTVNTLGCTIDSQNISNLTSYRATSDLFTWGPLPSNSVFGDPVHFPAGTTSHSVADGYYMLVQPLTPGDHTIHFTGGVPGFQLDITYNITVTPTNGVYPPGSTMFGKTYSEWSGAFFQYYFSLPATNNPFNYDPAHPHVPLGTGQSGPVWFVHGYRNESGTYSRNDIIPAGTSLLLVALDLFWDNTACPNPTAYTPAQLLSFVKSDVNGATNMYVKVDGVPVADISDVLTTPFRAQTIYDYTAPASDNMIAVAENEPCYQNNHGTPYHVTGAVGDGVVLMIPPLSPGSHTIEYQLILSTTSPVYAWNMTEHITVLPIIPTVAVSQQGGKLSLTWPQSATNYMVETTSSLDPPNWQPANLPVQALAGGVYQVNALVGTNSQFFRLRQH